MVILQTENDICLIQIAKLSPNQLFISDVYIFRKVVIRDMSSQLINSYIMLDYENSGI